MSAPVFLPQPKKWIAAKGVCAKLSAITQNDFWLLADISHNLHPEGYSIEVFPDSIQVFLGSANALHYAWQHFRQWRSESPQAVPCGMLEDAPGLSRRGFMLDISRCKVPRRESLEEWVRLLSNFRFNELQLYTEHSFAYKNHPVVWKNASPMDSKDIAWLKSVCESHGIELVPNQNCFGHFERWICHEDYRKYAESPDGFVTPWGDRRTVGSVLKPDENSYQLVTELLDELLPLFETDFVNIGCDETFELGQGASKNRCEKEGAGKVYTDFVVKIMDHVSKVHKKRPQFWGDIILKTPEELKKIPREAVALEWGYESGHPFEKDSKLFADSGLDFVICPGTSSWRSFAGRTENMLENIQQAVSSATQNGALGILLTDWGDHGHLQQNPVSYPALAWCGLLAWNPERASVLEAIEWCDKVAFRGSTGDTNAWLAAGRVSDLLEKPCSNCNAVFQLFQNPQETAKEVSLEKILLCLSAIDQLPTPKTFRAEWDQTLRNLRLPLLKSLNSGVVPGLLKETMTAHENLWRERNREGGLAESLSMYSQMAIEIKTGENDE